MQKSFVLFLMFLLSPVFVYADVQYSTDIPNTCSVDFPDTLLAIFTPIIYNGRYNENIPTACGVSHFPDTLYAVFTPIIYNGQYNENIPTACVSHFPDTLYAVFTPITYTCDAGYYLPANTPGCVICLAGSYCPGGTYTFNETLPQGIVACPTGLYTPTGMWESAQCGRMLHVGDGFLYLRTAKKTEHALHLDLDHDGVADFFGNMTRLDVPMTRGIERKLKVYMNNVIYSIYDDSVDLMLYSNEP